MNRTVKNIVIVFTLICIAAVIVFCVELVLLNREADELESPSLSESEDNGYDEQQDDPEDAYQEDDPDPPDEPTQTDEPEQNGESETPVVGARFVLEQLVVEKDVIVYADEELFEFFEGDIDITLTYKGEGEASVFIGWDTMSPPWNNPSSLVTRIMDGYLDGGDSRIIGDRGVGSSAIRGLFATGDKNGTTFEAWVVSLSSRDTEAHVDALVFVINYQNESQKEALYRILDTAMLYPEDVEEEEDLDPEDE